MESARGPKAVTDLSMMKTGPAAHQKKKLIEETKCEK